MNLLQEELIYPSYKDDWRLTYAIVDCLADIAKLSKNDTLIDVAFYGMQKKDSGFCCFKEVNKRRRESGLTYFISFNKYKKEEENCLIRELAARKCGELASLYKPNLHVIQILHDQMEKERDSAVKEEINRALSVERQDEFNLHTLVERDSENIDQKLTGEAAEIIALPIKTEDLENEKNGSKATPGSTAASSAKIATAPHEKKKEVATPQKPDGSEKEKEKKESPPTAVLEKLTHLSYVDHENGSEERKENKRETLSQQIEPESDYELFIEENKGEDSPIARLKNKVVDEDSQDWIIPQNIDSDKNEEFNTEGEAKYGTDVGEYQDSSKPTESALLILEKTKPTKTPEQLEIERELLQRIEALEKKNAESKALIEKKEHDDFVPTDNLSSKEIEDMATKCMENNGYYFTKHTFDKIRDTKTLYNIDITEDDILGILEFGEHEPKKDQYDQNDWKRSFRGKTKSGVDLRVIVVFSKSKRTKMRIITAIPILQQTGGGRGKGRRRGRGRR